MVQFRAIPKECPRCGRQTIVYKNQWYCPNCGAKGSIAYSFADDCERIGKCPIYHHQ